MFPITTMPSFHKALVMMVSVMALGQLGHFMNIPPSMRDTSEHDTTSLDHHYVTNRNLLRGSVASTTTLLPPLDIVYGGQGAHPGFLQELEASFKSVLLHAPLDIPLNIHFLVDAEAQQAITESILVHIDTETWKTRQPVTITTYNVEPWIEQWTQIVDGTYSYFPQELDWYRHTKGAYFRLFAHEVLPSSVNQFLYLDSDVIVMANLQHMWQQVYQSKAFFQWGAEWCSGFLVINKAKLQDFWRRIRTYDLITLTNYTVQQAQKTVHQKGLGDQFLLRSMAVTEPNLFATLPEAWDVSANDGPWWRIRERDGLQKGSGLEGDRPHGIGMLHFNGGGSSKASAFESHPFLVAERGNQPEEGAAAATAKQDPFPNTWGLAHYYNDLPWNFARYTVQSRVLDGIGYSIRVRHVQADPSKLGSSHTSQLPQFS